MKDLSLIVWLTQFGLSVAAPLIGFPLLGSWLQNRFSWGPWVFYLALGFGIFSAIEGLISSLKTLARQSKDSKQKEEPPLSFSEHD